MCSRLTTAVVNGQPRLSSGEAFTGGRVLDGEFRQGYHGTAPLEHLRAISQAVKISPVHLDTRSNRVRENLNAPVGMKAPELNDGANL
jgi:hypothetical protein